MDRLTTISPTDSVLDLELAPPIRSTLVNTPGCWCLGAACRIARVPHWNWFLSRFGKLACYLRPDSGVWHMRRAHN